MVKRKSQLTRIVHYLINHRRHGITPMQAMRLCGCMRLAARINDLRREGWEISTELCEEDGVRFARYRAI